MNIVDSWLVSQLVLCSNIYKDYAIVTHINTKKHIPQKRVVF